MVPSPSGHVSTLPSAGNQQVDSFQNILYGNTFVHGNIDKGQHVFEFGRATGNHEDRETGVVLFQPDSQFKSIHSREFVVQDCGGYRVFHGLNQGQGLQTTIGRHDLMSLFTQ